MAFTVADIPDQSGKLALITGATGGLGFETALALAGANSTVVLTGRNAAKGAEALARIRAIHPRANISYGSLDLGSLDAVARFADGFAARNSHLDILVNNAGVMTPPTRQSTGDGHELQFGTNHLAHFALTARLLSLLTAAASPRVVTVASIAHRNGSIAFDNLQSEQSYRPMAAYGQSKLANLLFARELQRRSLAEGWGITSLAAHPGLSSTDLIPNGMGKGFSGRAAAFFMRMFGQVPALGALPQIFAAVSPDAVPGGYYGPTGPFQTGGAVGVASRSRAAEDDATARRLWETSERLTGVHFPAMLQAA